MAKSNPAIQCCAGILRATFAMSFVVLYLKTDRLGFAVIASGLLIADAIYYGYLPESWGGES